MNVCGFHRVLHRLVLASVLALALSSLPQARAADGELVLNTGTTHPFTSPGHDGFLDQIATEVFRRIGLRARVEVYSASERALINADTGIDDGTVLRVRGLSDLYPNLVRVPEKLMDNDFVAYSLKHDIRTESWAALKPHAVAYIIGWKIVETNLDRMGDTLKARDADQMFTALKNGRADFAIFERWQGLSWARRNQMDVRVHEPPLASTEMFMFLHRKHAALVPGAAEALAAIKKDGTYKRIEDAVLTPLLKAR